jgi:hypothetical protein
LWPRTIGCCCNKGRAAHAAAPSQLATLSRLLIRRARGL